MFTNPNKYGNGLTLT